MRTTLAAMMLFTLLAFAAPAGQALASEKVWSKTLLAGEKQFITLHGDEDSWHVDLTDEIPGRLPEMVWRRAFPREAEALRFALSSVHKRYFELFTLKEAPSFSVAAVNGATLWKVTQSWSWEWEKRYAQWVESEVTPLFFKENGISTDCADVAYTLRWVFARINGLPAANRLTGSGVMFSQDSMKSDWVRLPTEPDWRKDRRFLAALDYLLEMTYTHTLLRDSYPIAISAESMTRGTHHLEIHGGSGHTLFVYKTDFSDTSTKPLEVMYSTTPRVIRELAHNGYWRAQQPQEGMGGFLRFRWPVRESDEWTLAAPASHPYFSKEQFDASFMAGKSTFAEAVLLKLNPKFDFAARLHEGIAYLRDQIQIRADTVSKGFEICSRTGCAETSNEYDDWSTFSRDARLGDLITQIQALIAAMNGKIQGFDKEWLESLKQSALTLDGESYTLGEMIFGWKNKTYSSDPRLPPTQRWGLAPQPFAEALANQLSSTLSDRLKRITTQGLNCQNPGECAPGSDGWTSWNTYDVDIELNQLSEAAANYCVASDLVRCKKMNELALSTHIQGSAGRNLTLSQWGELSLWLISDPRTPASIRWGGQRDGRKSFLFDHAGSLKVTASGLAATDLRNSFGGVNREVHLFDLPGATEIAPPATMSWAELEPQHEWMIARSQNPNSDGKIDLQILAPRANSQPVYQTQLKFEEFQAPEWMSKGVLKLTDPKHGVSLIDLDRSPVFEMHDLPNALVTGYRELGWLAGPNISGPYELVTYHDGQLVRQPFQGSLGTDNRPAYLLEQIPGFAIGSYVHCLNPECTEQNYQGQFAVNLRTGAITPASSGMENFTVTQDGKFALIAHYDENRFAELVELNSQLERISHKRLGIQFTHIQQRQGHTYCIVKDDAGEDRFWRYFKGEWTELQMLPDEKAILDNDGDNVILKTSAGTERIRKIGNANPVFESRKDDRLQILGNHPDSSGLLTIAVFHQGNENWGAIYDLNRPTLPLLTGKLPFFPPDTTLGLWFSTQTQPVTARGLLLPFGDTRKLWIDDQN